MKKKINFGLSATGKVAAALTLAFWVAEAALGAGIVAGGNGAQPQVSNAANGAAVVNIVAPSAAGLSHNQYQDFNVGKPGAVFNNSATGGQSQLAGQLGANALLGGREASVILNEVISRNPSLLLGKQEVFGKAADYVLANPNGITCAGCGFINTPRASLLVGNANIENGAITSLQAAMNGNALSVNGAGLSGVNVLDLIAPRIDVRGNVSARDRINVRAGFNLVDYQGDEAKIIRSDKAPEGVGSLDSVFLGAMQAGRINIISTADGAGVNVGGSLNGAQEVSVEANQGKLALEGAQIHASEGKVALAARQIDSRGRVETSTTQDSSHDESWFIWKTGETNTASNSSDTRIKRSAISARDDVALSAGDAVTLAATDISGRNVAVSGKDVTLDSQLAESASSSSNHAWKNSWAYNRDQNETTQRQEGVRIRADQDATLTAAASAADNQATDGAQPRGQIAIRGGSVSAGQDIRLQADGGVKLSGVTETDTRRDQGNRKNDGASLETGSWDNASSEQRLAQSQLRAGRDLSVRASGDINAKAAKLAAGRDAGLNAGGALSLGVQQTVSLNNQRNDQVYWGGIGGGGNRDNGKTDTVNTGSDLTAGGKLTLQGDSVAIAGSRARGEQDAVAISRNGDVSIDSVVNQSQTRTDQRSGTAFNITKSSSKGNASQQQAVNAELKSDTNLTIQSAKDVAISGSQVRAGGELNVSANGDIKVAASQTRDTVQSKDTELALRGVGEITGDKQYRGGVRIEHTSSSVDSDSTQNQAATLSGGKVALNAQGDLAVTGSTLNAGAGGAALSGQNVSLNAAQDTVKESKSSSVTGGGIYIDAGLDKTGVALGVDQKNSSSRSESSTAQVSAINSKGGVSIVAGNGDGDIRNQGAQVKADGDIKLAGGRIDNQAANSTQKTTTDSSHWGVEVGVNADYSGVTRPLVAAGEKVAKGDVAGAAGAAGNLGAANLGVDVGVKAGVGTETSQSSTAQASSLNGGNVKVDAKAGLSDQGTQYQAANTVEIKADSHQFTAAANTQSQSGSKTEADVGVRVYTTTGEDVNVKAAGSGSTVTSASSSSTAVTGGIRAGNGVKVDVDNNAAYQGVAIAGGKGAASVNAGGDLSFSQASNTSSSEQRTVGGKANLAITTSPIEGGGKNVGGSGAVAVNVDKQQANSSTAVTGGVDADAGVALTAGGKLALQGDKIASRGDVALKGDKVEFKAAESSADKSGSQWGFDVKAGGSQSNGQEKASQGFNVGAGGNYASTDESSRSQAGGSVAGGGKTSIEAGSGGIRLSGTQVQGDSVKLDSQGDVRLESAQSSSQRNNLSVAGNIGGGNKASSDKENGQIKPDSTKNVHDVSAGLSVKVDQQDKLSNANASVTGKQQVELNAEGNATLAGANVSGKTVTGQVGGKLALESRQDRDNSVKVDVALGVNSSNGKDASLVDQAADKAGPLKDKVKEKGTELVNAASDKVKEKYDSLAFNKGLKEDTTNAVSFNANSETVTLPEQPTSGPAKSGTLDTLARKGGNTLKDKLLNAQDKGTELKADVDVSVKRDNSVGTVTGIAGADGVTLQVGGKTQLTGATVSSANGKVDLGDSKVETADIATERYNGGGGVKLNSTPSGILKQAIGDVTSGKAPLIRAEHENAPTVVQGGIQSK
ncbi:hemagglutinin repeat-containing protein [Chromobacterium vaccinii]|uniref:hemagglutinin repeat-containing protein n=1 Tax=Chromobacterium vaccinii TaxID=1108595 RepID=UPI003260DFFB